MTDGFAHHLELDRLRDGERIDLVADEAERAAIAKRLDLAALDRLEAHVCIDRTGDVIQAAGRLMASLDQSCVVTGDPVAAHVDEAFTLLFVPEPAGASEDEVELTEKDLEVVFHDGSAIDLGGALADTLALSLDPYPRSAGADAALKEAGVLTEEQASPFAVLAKLMKDES